ncbi:MAG: hypothetical protein KA352_16065 [Flavobacteriales bacterium]|nr:hypothetical protein [Flavobacteriales bacterium]
MRGFLIKTSIALLLVLVAHLVAGFFADGRTDDYYLRFTGDRRPSLILGTSRAAQGLRPAVIAPLLQGSGVQTPLFNFAFTIAHSPYGPTYAHAVEAKLRKDDDDGLFLVTVDPWSLSNQVDKQGHMGPMREVGRKLVEQWTYTGTPNYEYLLRHMRAGWGSLIAGPLHDPDTLGFLHDDGWLEIRARVDSATVRERTARKVRHYAVQVLPRNRPSDERIASLEQIVDLLQPHGTVYLIRLPVCNAIAELENELWPTFNERMQKLADNHGIQYWDFLPERDRYTYTDGNHLDTVSSRAFSTAVGLRLAAGTPPGR